MLFRSSTLVVCLLGCAVVQGFTHKLDFQGKNPLRDTRDMDDAMTLEEAISSYDAMASEIVSFIPSCEDVLIYFKNKNVGAAENYPDHAQYYITGLQMQVSRFSKYLERHMLTGSSYLDELCF